jgi:hypothetical protein
MRRTVARLADGREIIFYDRAESAAREVAADRRPLADPGDGSQMRYDAVLEEWVDGTSEESLASLAYPHLQLFSIQRAPGKLKYLAGSESAMGVFVNDVVPEAVAARLRELR